MGCARYNPPLPSESNFSFHFHAVFGRLAPHSGVVAPSGKSWIRHCKSLATASGWSQTHFPFPVSVDSGRSRLLSKGGNLILIQCSTIKPYQTRNNLVNSIAGTGNRNVKRPTPTPRQPPPTVLLSGISGGSRICRIERGANPKGGANLLIWPIVP